MPGTKSVKLQAQYQWADEGSSRGSALGARQADEKAAWGNGVLEGHSRLRNDDWLWQSLSEDQEVWYSLLNLGNCRVGLVCRLFFNVIAAALIAGRCWITTATTAMHRGCWHSSRRAGPATNRQQGLYAE